MPSATYAPVKMIQWLCLLFVLACMRCEASETKATARLRGLAEQGELLEIPASWKEDFLAAVNAERAKEGLPALCANTKLDSAAQRHSQDMATNNFLGHTGTDGSSLTTRFADEGFQWSAVAENVAGGQKTVAAVLQSWMSSPGHRANILGNYQYVGVGLAQTTTSDYTIYWTLTFGSSPSESCACILK